MIHVYVLNMHIPSVAVNVLEDVGLRLAGMEHKDVQNFSITLQFTHYMYM